ncbi:MAG: DNA-binding response regulator [Calditrichaeota bacterium]|nr:MAG: DNA-binding response regulator [Calditrichota bacterium]MBL1208099.1 DNA-binding response regulator [Calditrichota bacterium]NOG47937.1 response regulator transcription factor [Calditrichota bacterium]
MKLKINISLVEDDNLIRSGLVTLISETEEFSLCGDYSNCEDLLDDIEQNTPGIILMDIDLPGISGIEGVKKVKLKFPQIDIIILTVHENDDLVFEALCNGACGYLTKNIKPERLLESIRDVVNGGSPMSTNIARMVVRSFQKNIESPLTNRETEVLNLLSRGKSYNMIADDIFINKETVRTHIKNIYRKLEVHSKADAIEKAIKQKLI